MMNNPLALDQFNTVILGNGAIGQALAHAIGQYPGSRGLALLGRSGIAGLEGKGIVQLPVDATQPHSITAAAQEIHSSLGNVHLLINTVGVLHREGQQPEKRLRDLQPDNLLYSCQVNGLFVALVADAFAPLLRHDQPSLLASLSARVGSIADNDLGGWYSYRASKATHNMLLRTVSREWRVSHRNTAVVALHPGTVESRLSQPFIGKNYRNRVLTPQECADALLAVMADLTPDDTGRFLDWRGDTIPW